MHGAILFLLLTLFFSSTPSDRIPGTIDRFQAAESHIQQLDRAILEKGLKMEEQGKYREALTIWLNAKATLPEPSTMIGSNYIRLVTEQNIREQYPSASAMYYWGLSANDVAMNKDYLRQEFEFTEHLLEKEQKTAWRRLLNQNDPSLFEKIRNWWESADPTPGSTYNERLLEHWERIAYAREHFDRTEESVYGTDARGPVYVKWGEPEWTFTGNFHLTMSEAERIALMLGAGSRGNARSIASAALHLHEGAYFEVWVYLQEHLDHNENITITFGSLPLEGFGRAYTVEDFIPSRGFTLSARYDYVGMTGQRNSAVNPAMVLQWQYYKLLATKDHYFAEKFWRMERDWLGVFASLGKARGGRRKQEHFHTTIERFNRAPKEASTYLKDMPEIPLDIRQYRLLDDLNRPIFATVVESRPQQAFMEDFAFNQDSMLSGQGDASDTASVQEAFESYRLYHGVEVRDPENGRLTGERIQPMLMLDGSDMQVTSGSLFTIPFVSEQTNQYFYAELHNDHEKSRPRMVSTFPEEMRGLGRVVLPQPAPLENDPSQLQMSDLIIGYSKRDSSSDTFLPFVVTNDRKIPQGEELVVHVELYHLQEGAGGLREFTLTYEILPVNFLGWTRERKENLSVSLFLENDHSRYREDMEIKAANLDPGRYVLRMEATDGNSEQQVRREVHFEVVES